MNKETKQFIKELESEKCEAICSFDDNGNPLCVTMYRVNADPKIRETTLLYHAGIDLETLVAIKLTTPQERVEMKKIAKIKSLKQELQELEASI